MQERQVIDDYSRYEGESEEIRQNYAKLISEFSTWIGTKGLSKKTIEDDCPNIDFYINEFLLYEDIVSPEDGALSVGMLLGYWFIQKAIWAAKTSIKSNAFTDLCLRRA